MNVEFPVQQTSPIARVKPVGNLTAPLITIGAIAALHHETLWSMIVLWSRSQTFAHGFIIAPISAWMIWRQRDYLARFEPNPASAALILLAVEGIIWLLASLANVPVVTQYAVVSMIPSAVIATLGWHISRLIAFPLAYLLLAVPFGEIFIPYLIDFTANFTVSALQFTGIPVFREHNYFSIPSGTWSVIEACSGLRYLIASFALGTLYAQLNYRSLRHRLIFICITLLVPILANGVRAYLIVMIGHWSNMQLAVGIDHLIYGWIFFGLVSLTLFWCASLWTESATNSVPTRPQPGMISPKANSRQIRAALASVSVVACWPLLAALLTDTTVSPRIATLEISPVAPWVVAPISELHWGSPNASMPLHFRQSYRGANGTVHLQLTLSSPNVKDAGLLTSDLYPLSEHWSVMSNDHRSIVIGTRRLHVLQTILRKNEHQNQLVWRWYRQSAIDTDSLLLVKLLLAKSKLLRTGQDHAEIMVAAPFDENSANAEFALLDFLTSMFPAIDKGLRDAAGR
jgi:exosortase A